MGDEKGGIGVAEDDVVGVLVIGCELVDVCQPTVSVWLVDGKTGQNAVTEVANVSNSTTPFNSLQYGSYNPVWNQTVTINLPFRTICDAKNSNFLLLFEINDLVQQSTSIFAMKRQELVKGRVAWAFLKPIGANGDLNSNKEVVLQLYKIVRKCSTSHRTCPVFHLYSEHKRKKYRGVLRVNVKPHRPSTVRMPTTTTTSEPPVHGESSTEISPRDETIAVPSIQPNQWSRLPTQSCKVPTSTYAEIPVSRRGTSCLTFSHSGLHLACGSFSRVLVIDVLNPKEATHLNGHTGLVYEVSFSEDDSLLLSVSADCCAIVWGLKPISKKPMFVLPHPSFVYCGKWLHGLRMITGGKDSLIRYWEKGEIECKLLEEVSGHSGFVSCLNARGDSLMFSGDSCGHVKMWGLENDCWVALRTFSLKDMLGAVVDSLNLHPGRRRVVVTWRKKGSAMIDVAADAVVKIYCGGNLQVRSLSCLSPCGSLFFTFGAGNIINVWEFETGTLLATYQNLFPDLGLSDLSGCAAYHPYEHLMGFGLMGAHHPLVLLHFNYKEDESEKLGLKFIVAAEDNPEQLKNVGKGAGESKLHKMDEAGHADAQQDKIAAIVRKIDRILSVKREMTNRVGASVPSGSAKSENRLRRGFRKDSLSKFKNIDLT